MGQKTKLDNRRLPLKQARIRAGLTQRQVGAMVGVSHVIIGRLERSWEVDTDPAVKEAIRTLLKLKRFPEKRRAG